MFLRSIEVLSKLWYRSICSQGGTMDNLRIASNKSSYPTELKRNLTSDLRPREKTTSVESRPPLKG